MLKGVFRIVLLVVLVCVSKLLIAQPGPPGGDPDENPVPITGIEYLIAAGAAFGAKKIYDKRKSK